MAKPRTLSLADYAAEVGVSVETVRGWIHTGRLRAIKVGCGVKRRHFRLTAQAIREFERGEIFDTPSPAIRRAKPKEQSDFITYY